MNGSQNRYFINNVSLKIPRKSNSSKYGPIIHIIKTTVATIEICGKWSFCKSKSKLSLISFSFAVVSLPVNMTINTLLRILKTIDNTRKPILIKISFPLID